MLKALTDLYDRLVEEGHDISLPGYSSVKVSHVFIINENGELVAIQSINNDNKNLKFIVPEQLGRSGSKIAPNLLCDNISYFLGIEGKEESKIKISLKKYNSFKQRNQEFLADINNPISKAIYAFLETWKPENYLNNEIIDSKLIELLKGSNLIFKLDNEVNFAHEDEFIIDKLEKTQDDGESELISQCLVTGKEDTIARLHMPIKPIIGASPSGAMLVSFNQQSFESYGKHQGYNSPISKTATFKYGTALNYLANNKNNKTTLGDMTLFFWASKTENKETEELLSFLFNMEDVSDKDIDVKDDEPQTLKKPKKTKAPIQKNDNATSRKFVDILKRLRDGYLVGDLSIPENSNLYLLGVVASKSRLSIRYWENNSIETIIGRISKHYEDLNVIGLKNDGFITPFQILINMAVLSERKNIQPQWGRILFESIVNETPYAPALYHSMLTKCFTIGNDGGVNPVRVAFVKAYLKRHYRLRKQYEKEAIITVSLNKLNDNIGYLLGRLFYTLENIQTSANPSIQRTIVDSFFSSSVRTPSHIFTHLLMLSNHHMSKMRKINIGQAINLDKQKQDILDKISEFPLHLSLEDQGMFILGYHHQKQERFTPKKDKKIIELNIIEENSDNKQEGK